MGIPPTRKIFETRGKEEAEEVRKVWDFGFREAKLSFSLICY
jgi:hypothetical protein